MKGDKGIGVISDYEEQPLISKSHLGEYAIVHVGRVNNLEELTEDFIQRGNSFSEVSPEGSRVNPIELIASLINRQKNYVEGIEFMQEQIEGSSSIMLLTKEGIYLARDKLGRTPLVIGKREKDGAYAMASETCAFPNLNIDDEGMGFRVEKYLGPGEIVRIDGGGCEQLKKPGKDMQICSFLWVYYGYPASRYEGKTVETVRYKCGATLARADDTEIDVVAGVPDSGTGHAIGFANEKGIPFMRPYIKYTPTWPRSFMPQDKKTRNLVGRMKLIPIQDLIKGKKLLFCEDSVVRGTQLQNTVKRLYEYGAEEVHMRPACPPLVYGCKFLNFSRSESELDLVARKSIEELEGKDAEVSKYVDENSENHRKMVDRIRLRLSLTTLKYQKLDDLISAIGLPKEKLCTYCWDGCEGCK